MDANTIHKTSYNERNDIYIKRAHDPRYLVLALDADQSSDFSESAETPRMRFLQCAPVTIQDDTKEWHGASAAIDTGSPSSFISKTTVELYGLKTRPLMPKDILSFKSPIEHAVCKPISFVRVPLKSKKFGLEQVIAKLRVMETNEFEILLGRAFIDSHELMAKLGKMDRNGNIVMALRSTLSSAEAASDRTAREKDRQLALKLTEDMEASPATAHLRSRSSYAYTSASTSNNKSIICADQRQAPVPQQHSHRAAIGGPRRQNQMERQPSAYSAGGQSQAASTSSSKASATSWDGSMDWHSQASSNTSWDTRTFAKYFRER